MRPRRNGLSAESYSPLRNIDPRLTEAALEALKDAGVAAYAVPATNQPVLGFEMVTADRPTDRLYVDTSAVDEARRVIDEAFPDDEEPAGGDDLTPVVVGDGAPDGPDLDAVFEQVFAGFDDAGEDPQRRWPDEEDLSRDDRGQDDDPGDAPPASDQQPVARANGNEDHYVPPPPPPLPQLEPATKLAWAGVLGGPLILLATVFGLSIPSWLAGTAILAFVAGFVALVVRLKDSPDDSDPDDGAVV